MLTNKELENIELKKKNYLEAVNEFNIAKEDYHQARRNYFENPSKKTEKIMIRNENLYMCLFHKQNKLEIIWGIAEEEACNKLRKDFYNKSK